MGFKDPIAPKEKKKSMKSPWNFDAPEYDQRSSCFVSAGTDYGVGHKTPVGTEGNANMSNAVPTGRQSTMPLYAKGTPREMIEDQ